MAGYLRRAIQCCSRFFELDGELPELASARSPRSSSPGPLRQRCEIGETSAEDDVLAKAREAAMGIAKKGSFPLGWEEGGGEGGDPLAPNAKGTACKNGQKTCARRKKDCPLKKRKDRKQTCAQRKLKTPAKKNVSKRPQFKNRKASAEVFEKKVRSKARAEKKVRSKPGDGSKARAEKKVRSGKKGRPPRGALGPRKLRTSVGAA